MKLERLFSWRLSALALGFLILSAGCTPPPPAASSQMPSPVPTSSTAPVTDTPAPLITPSPTTRIASGTNGGANATLAGLVSVPYPTFSNLSIEWLIEGDANTDGMVSVRFRKLGEVQWQDGMPLRRVPAGSNPKAGFNWPNKHSGSIFNLEPGTMYEIELTLSDPDGGSTTHTLTAATRTVPAPVAGAPVHLVTPATFIRNTESVQPGDILELGAGEYPGFTFLKDGEIGRPIVIRSLAGAVINGSINLDQRKYILLDGLQVNGSIHFYNGDSISVTRCRVNTSGDGIVFKGHAQNAYIADNIVIGSTIWQKTALGVNGDNNGEGIQFSGPGHVVEHNTVVGFRDNISLMEGVTEAIDQFSIDILANDIYEAADDGVEADYCFHNCRIIGNRLTNVFMGLSSQPGLGGPTYFIRNAMYNVVYSPFKLHNGSVGDVILQNTVVKSGDAIGVYTGDFFSRAFFRNNLFIGGPGGIYNGYSSGKGLIASLEAADPTSTFDYDAFGTLAERFFGQIGSHLFLGLDELRSKTSEKHAIQVDLSVFNASVAYPAKPFPGLLAPDLRPRAGSAVEDAALLIPNINNKFNGKGPDIGAFEVGEALPVFGARGEIPGGAVTPSVPTASPTIQPTPVSVVAIPVPLVANVIADFNAPLVLANGTTFGMCDLLTMETAGTPNLTVTGDGYLLAQSPSKTDGFVIRSTAPLPATYRISVDVGNIEFDLLNKTDEENGLYFIAISDEPGKPAQNNWWHAHRKIVLDTDNNMWNSGGKHPVFFGYYNSSDDIRFYDSHSNSWVNDWNAALNYESDTWYTFELEKTNAEYIYRVYERDINNLLIQASIPLSSVKGKSAPDYLAIGDPHTNYYAGSAAIDNIRITNTGCGK